MANKIYERIKYKKPHKNLNGLQHPSVKQDILYYMRAKDPFYSHSCGAIMNSFIIYSKNGLSSICFPLLSKLSDTITFYLNRQLTTTSGCCQILGSHKLHLPLISMHMCFYKIPLFLGGWCGHTSVQERWLWNVLGLGILPRRAERRDRGAECKVSMRMLMELEFCNWYFCVFFSQSKELVGGSNPTKCESSQYNWWVATVSLWFLIFMTFAKRYN